MEIPVRKWKRNCHQNTINYGEEELEVLKSFIQAYDLDKPTSGRVCVRRLQDGKQCLEYNPKHPEHKCHIPHADHPSLWLKDGDPTIYVCHLYPFSGYKARDILDFCEEKNLKVTFRSGLSFWNPGNTIAVVVQKKG